MIRLSLSIWIVGFYVSMGISQQIAREVSELEYLADIMINTTAGKHRSYAAKQFDQKLREALDAPNSFSNDFDSLKWISIQYPPDSTFRIFSWQVRPSSSSFKYRNILQKSDGKTITLEDNFEPDEDFEYDELTDQEWYGLLLYDIKEIDSADGKYYMLFGVHQEDAQMKSKVLETMFFDNEDVIFGKNVFLTNPDESRPRFKKRIQLKYNATSNVDLNYNPGLEAIVYDHIISHQGGMGLGNIVIPDGSYEAYKLENDQWVYVEKVFDLIMDEPPMEKEKKKSNRDIMGRTKKVKP